MKGLFHKLGCHSLTFSFNKSVVVDKENIPIGVVVIPLLIDLIVMGYGRLDCVKITKSLKSQVPQSFSGCLDIENDETNKIIFPPKFNVLPYEANDCEKKCFGLKNVLPNLKMAWDSTYIITLNQILK